MYKKDEPAAIAVDYFRHNNIGKSSFKGVNSWERKWNELMQARQDDRRCRNCGGRDHWEYNCEGDCGKCVNAIPNLEVCTKYYRSL